MGMRPLVGMIVAFALSVLVAPLVLQWTRKAHAGQPILHYVSEHNAKQGTPTMGGWIFILPILAVCLALGRPLGSAWVGALAVTMYAVLGFLDDYLKIRRADNGGLKPYQKIIGQLGIALVLAWYMYRNQAIGGVLDIPFTSFHIDLKWGIIPFAALVLIAGTNAVNLTDGLDGLAGGTVGVYMAVLAVINAIVCLHADVEQAEVAEEMVLLSLTTLGGVMGFLLCNIAPAKIFMGDTGSMALGGAVCCVAMFGRNTLYLPLVGIMFVVSCISVIVQVVYFKLTKGKRLLLMAPLHHHLQRKGRSEAQVAGLYKVITALAGVVAVAGVWIAWIGMENVYW